MSFKKEYSALVIKQNEELRTLIVNYLNSSFAVLFERNPHILFVKINTVRSEDNPEYDTTINKDSETIVINGLNFSQIENRSEEDVIDNTGMTSTEHEEAGTSSEIIFSQIDDSILHRLYGSFFGLKVDRTGVTVESSDYITY